MKYAGNWDLNLHYNHSGGQKGRKGVSISSLSPYSGFVTVVGHSLGGHLAAAFPRLFPEVADNYEAVIDRRLVA